MKGRAGTRQSRQRTPSRFLNIPGSRMAIRDCASVFLAALTLMLAPAAAQDSQPTPGPGELPEPINADLGRVSDFSFSYDGPALVALLAYLKTSGQPPGHARQPV